ncbi:MAG: hypothetical protein JXI33_08250 [Candidatus Aminicenantes bacterium]|nr:hypothetical protein [Candidatus Aminicenantes bacterium]
MTIAIGGLVIEIRSTKNLPFLPNKRFLPFQAHTGHSQITWEYHLVKPALEDQKKNNPATSPGNRTRHALSASHQRCSSPVDACLQHARENNEWTAIEVNAGAVTVLDFKKNRADIFFGPKFANELCAIGIGSAMLAPFLPNFEACLLHAAAVVRNGRAAVFLAPDEGGKTTAARLAPSGTILGDDQVLARLSADGFEISGTPWGLHVDSKLKAPLSGFFLLEKASDFSLTPLRTRELLPLLWTEAECHTAIMPRRLKKKAFALTYELAAAVPAWKMSFKKDDINWDEIDKKMAG